MEFADGALIAQLGTPDMRLPILYAMAYPEPPAHQQRRAATCSVGGLTFERPDEARSLIRLARECLRAGGAAGCVLNAADEDGRRRIVRSSGKEPMRIGRDLDTEEAFSHMGNLPAASLEQVMKLTVLHGMHAAGCA